MDDDSESDAALAVVVTVASEPSECVPQAAAESDLSRQCRTPDLACLRWWLNRRRIRSLKFNIWEGERSMGARGSSGAITGGKQLASASRIRSASSCKIFACVSESYSLRLRLIKATVTKLVQVNNNMQNNGNLKLEVTHIPMESLTERETDA